MEISSRPVSMVYPRESRIKQPEVMALYMRGSASPRRESQAARSSRNCPEDRRHFFFFLRQFHASFRIQSIAAPSRTRGGKGNPVPPASTLSPIALLSFGRVPGDRNKDKAER